MSGPAHPGTWVWPVDSVTVTSPYGMRTHPVFGDRRMHTGTDYRAPTGTPVYAVAAGRVSRSAFDPAVGNHVRIVHADGRTSRYYHLSRRRVSVGDQVRAGQRIGDAGATGTVTAAHLHLEIRTGGEPGTPIDPHLFLTQNVQGDDMPITRADADLIVDRLLARRIEHTAGQKAASNRDSATVERILGDTSAGGFRAWKDLPALRAELAATRAALVALAKNTGLDPKAVERIITRAVDQALSDISITLTTGD